MAKYQEGSLNVLQMNYVARLKSGFVQNKISLWGCVPLQKVTLWKYHTQNDLLQLGRSKMFCEGKKTS